MKHLSILFATTLFSALTYGSGAQAATIVSVTDNTCVGYVPNDSSLTNQTIRVDGGGSQTDPIGRRCGTSATAMAGGGFTGVELAASSDGVRSSVSGFGSWSDSFSVTAPVGYMGGPITVGVAFSFDALIFQNVPNNETSNAGTSANYRVTFGGQSTMVGSNPQSVTFSDRLDVLENRPSAPSLVVLDNPALMFFSVLPGIDAFNLSMSLQATLDAFAPDATANALFDALNTASLASDGPAFILPDGFFVTNEAANVYNNYWIDPRIDVAPVPLPAGLPLLIFGIGALAFTHRRP